MLEYDLNNTSLFECGSRATMLSEAETFAITAAMLVVYNVAYTDLRDGDLLLTADAVEPIAACLEGRLSPLVRDIEYGGRVLRERLRDFVGLRISYLTMGGTHACSGGG